MKNVALKVVERAPFYRKDFELPSSEEVGEPHSLHATIPFPESSSAVACEYFISRYSKKGGVVLDPFCGSGVTPLQAALMGRVPYACDANPLAVAISRAKTCPADLTEVTLRLQQANLRRPVDMQLYRKGFSNFYDVDTFREVLNLRSFIQDQYDRTARFIELVALSLLHGHSAGYFSVYTFPQVSASPQEQEELNLKRRQIPDYRAVVPRILRKTASLLRDGFPSVLSHLERHSRFAVSDARNLSFVSANSVDLVMSSPPLPGARDYLDEMWLRLWFARVPFANLVEQLRSTTHSVSRSGLRERLLEDWLEFMNESLLELARVLKPGGRCLFDLREVRLPETKTMGAQNANGQRVVQLEEELAELVSSSLSRFYEVEGILVNAEKCSKLDNCINTRDTSGLDRRNRILILRRK